MAEYTTIGELDDAVFPLDDDKDLIEIEQPAQSPAGRKIAISDIVYHPVLTIRDRGYVSGFDIYKVGNQEICIRPGVRYYTNGTLETVIEKTDFQSIAADVIDTLTASKWYGVFLSSAGVVSINTTPLVGTSAQRPTDNFYGWNDGDNDKYRHDRQGYYDGNNLCIGCIYLDASKYVTYIINNYSGTDEIGVNANGNWKRDRITQECWRTGISIDVSTIMNYNIGTYGCSLYTGNSSVVFPVTFYEAPILTPGSERRMNSYAVLTESGFDFYAANTSSQNDTDHQYRAIGPWHA